MDFKSTVTYHDDSRPRHEEEDDGGVTVTMDDGRFNVNIDENSPGFNQVVQPLLRSITKEIESNELNPVITQETTEPIPRLNIVMQIIGSRGDVQPFIALALELKKQGHRIRIATHPTFQQFIEEHDLEFFSIGGDPKELMQFMVNNPNLIPGIEAIRSGEVGRRQKGMAQTIQGCWRSCYESGNGLEDRPNPKLGDVPFVADAIIANPPSFAHIHCAEKLGIPLHIVFTMPWNPTTRFPHPLANIQSSNADPKMTNLLSYIVVDALTWQGLGSIINKFRRRSLALESIDPIYAIGLLWRQKIPHSYCWSPALIPKPSDWADHINLTSFYFLPLASTYEPPTELMDFLDNGPPPIYIGFGSIVVDDPNELTAIVLKAVQLVGVRAIVSQGWGGLGALDIPENIYMIGNCPHDWLFPRVRAVVHHGGAGTVSAGLKAGKPTVVVPFFGDQPFWGEMIARAGAGPRPIPYKELDAHKLAAAITFALESKTFEQAEDLAKKLEVEDGPKAGAESFHGALPLDTMKCSFLPDRFAVWRLKGTRLHLCPLAATILLRAGKIDPKKLRLYRACEYDLYHGPYDIISGPTTLTVGWATEMVKGINDISTGMVRSTENLSTASLRRRRQSDMSSRPSRSSLQSEEDLQSDSSRRTPTNTSHGTEERAESVRGDVLRPTETTSSTHSLHSSSMASTAVSEPTTDATTAVLEMSRDQEIVVPSLGLDENLSRTKKGVTRIVSSTTRFPGEMLNTIAKGLGNSPKMWGDKTVRRQRRITGYQSGLAAAGEAFVLGVWDGVTGLATQPVKGAVEGGVGGAFKGAGVGIMSSLFKPVAGMASLFAFPIKGIEKEIDRGSFSATQHSIISSRLEQGEHEMRTCTEEQRKTVLDVFYYCQEASKREKKQRAKVEKDKQDKKRKELQQADKEIREAKLLHEKEEKERRKSLTKETGKLQKPIAESSKLATQTAEI